MRHKRFSLFTALLISLSLITALALGSPSAAYQDATEEAAAADNFGALLRFTADVPYAAPFYAAIRTDEAFTGLLDDLLQQAQAALPELVLPPDAVVTMDQLLEMASQSVFNAGFETEIRPWLGDTAAIALFSFDEVANFNVPQPSRVAFYVDITDREAAADFLETFFASMPYQGWERQDSGERTLFVASPSANPAYIEVRDDAIIFASRADVLAPEGGFNGTLADYPSFQRSLVALPAASYNMVAYLDLPVIMSYSIGNTYYTPDEDRLLQASLIKTVGPLAIGGTVEDDRRLVLDVALSAGNLAGAEAAGLSLGGDFQVDPAFMSRIPTDAALVVHGTQLAGGVDFLRRNANGVIDMLAGTESGSEVSAFLFGALERIGEILSTNTTGLSLEGDIANWLNDDFAVFVRYREPVSFPSIYNAVDFAVLLEASDNAASVDAMQTLGRDLPITLRALSGPSSYSVFREELIEGQPALVILQSVSYPERALIETLVIAADDSLLVIGTRDAVTDVLRTRDGGAVPDFITSETGILQEPGMVWYANPRALPQFIDLIYYYDYSGQQRAVPNALLTLLQSASASLAINEQGDTVVRFTLTLDDPDEVQANAAAATATYEARVEQLQAAATTYAATQIATATATQEYLDTLPTLVPFVTPTMTPVAGVDSSLTLYYGQTSRGYLIAGTRDSWSFYGQAGNSISILMESDEFDPFLELYDEQGNLIALDDDSGGSFNALIETTLPAAGLYTVVAQGYSASASGEYFITLDSSVFMLPTSTPFHPPTIPSPVSAVVNVSSTRMRETPSVASAVIAELTRNEAVTVLGRSADNGYVLVVTADGQRGWVARQTLALSNPVAELPILDSQSIPPVITAIPISPTPIFIPTEAIGTTLIYGQTATAYLDAFERERWDFHGRAGEAIAILMRSDDFDPFLELYDEQGILIASDDDSGGSFNALITVTLPAAGRYTVVAQGYSASASGEYTLTLDRNTFFALPTSTLSPLPTAVPTESASDPGAITFSSGEPVLLGLAAGLSGEGIAPLGIDIQRGVEIAIMQRPSVTVGGQAFDVSLDVQDDLCSAEGGQAVANRFVSSEDIVAVVGPMCSSACRAAAPIFDSAGFTTISPSCTAPDLTASGHASFNRSVVSDAFQGRVAAEFIFNELGVTRIATIHDGSPYGEGVVSMLTQRFEALGGEIVAADAVNVGDTDFRALLEDIAAEDPDLIYFAGFAAEAARIAQQREDAGLESVPMMGADGIHGTEFVELAGDAAESVWATSYTVFPQAEAYEEFEELYEDTYGELPPAPYHATAYDAANLLLDAIEATGQLDENGNLVISRAAISAYVRGIEGYSGLTGILNADGTGELATATIDIVQVQDGEFAPQFVARPENGEIVIEPAE